jgi:glyoxylase-like metal-dependent hydrolase (beta-lactamase superfamily II)
LAAFILAAAAQHAVRAEPAPARIPGRVHHLDGATLHPWVRPAVEGVGAFWESGTLVCHLLAVETPRGITLVDTGLGTRDVAESGDRLPGFWKFLTRPVLDPGQTAVAHVERLGYSRNEVTDIVMTHLDLDHAGGLSDFPQATVHVSDVELETARTSTAGRYRAVKQAGEIRWLGHNVAGEDWFGLGSVRIAKAGPEQASPSDPEVRLVSLPGHSPGNCGVAVKSGDSWLLHAGDAYFHHDEVDQAERSCPFGLEMFQRVAQVSGADRLGTQERLRALARDATAGVRVFSAHDHAELAAFR